MKQKVIHALIVGIFFIGFVSCKNSNAFDFSMLDDIEANGQWGIPLLKKDKISINSILEQWKAGDFIEQDANGNLFYHLELKEHSFSDTAFLQFSRRSLSRTFNYDNIILPSGTWNMPQVLSFQLDTTSIIVDYGIVKRGTLFIQLSHNLDVSRYQLQLTCPEIEQPSGAQLSQIVNTQTANLQINMAGYKITPTPNNRFNVLISLTSTSDDVHLSSYHLDIDVSMENLLMKSVSGKIRAFPFPFSDRLPLDWNLGSHIGGDVALHGASLTAYIKNSYNILGTGQLDTAEMLGFGCYPVLQNAPFYFSIPFSPNNFQEINILKDQTIPSFWKYNQFHVAGTVILNPGGFEAGQVHYDDESQVIAKFGITVPFKMSANHLYYRDTTTFNIDSLANLENVFDILESADFRLFIKNGLPLTIDAQVYFYDSQQNRYTDSLFKVPVVLPGNYGQPLAPNISILAFNQSRLQKIRNADKIIYRVGINTDGRQIQLNAADFIETALGVKFKYNHINLGLNN